MSAGRALHVVSETPEARKRKGRSRVTNHKDLLPDLDGRLPAARRFRDLVNSYIVDMGGLDCCSDIKLGLLRRLAAVTVQSELIEARMISGEQVDIGTLCTLASTSVRLATRLNPRLERVAKEVGPTLTDLIRADQERQRQELVRQP
jgi:hypothetical protein